MLDQLDHAMTAALRAGNQEEFERLAIQAENAHAAREDRLRAPDALTRGAIWYAKRGIPVFPLQPGDKKPYPGSHGFKDATTDTDIVNAWWQDKPTSNIGIPTGGLFDVIDIDGPEGFYHWGHLKESGALPEILGTAWTRRGLHVYIPAAGAGNTTGFRRGLDYRGRGGYVVAPPSIVGGRRYDWDKPLPQLVAA